MQGWNHGTLTVIIQCTGDDSILLVHITTNTPCLFKRGYDFNSPCIGAKDVVFGVNVSAGTLQQCKKINDKVDDATEEDDSEQLKWKTTSKRSIKR